MKRIVLLCVTVTFLIGVYAEGMIEVFSWRQIDYYNRGDQFVGPAPGPGGDNGSRKQRPGPIVFPSNRRAKRANDEWRNSRDPRPDVDLSLRFAGQPGNSSTYIPYNNVPMGATHHKGRLFVTMPRRRVGIPSTLNYIDMKADGNKPSPKLRAYPNFETNYLSPDLRVDPSRLLSVYRTTVDECERLWFIDTGILEYPGNQQQLQKPSIWVVDLKTDRVLHRYEMPTETVERGNGLASISVDVMGGNCSNTYAYVPDLMNYRLYVFSLAEMDIWTFSHNYFNFDPLAGDLRIGGQSFRWNDGIFSTTLGPRDRRGYRNMYFHAMASNNEFYVNTEVLQDRANTGSVGDSNDFQILGSRGQARQSTMHEYDPRTGVIFYNEIQRNGIGCWNTNKPFSADNHGTVIEDAERMIYPSDLTIDTDGNMWVMSNSMPIFIYSELDPSIVNFRVWKQNVNMAARNTVCQMRRR